MLISKFFNKDKSSGGVDVKLDLPMEHTENENQGLGRNIELK